MDFPRDWKERTKNRSASVPLSPKERAIIVALNSPITVNFNNSRLEDVIEYLQTFTGQPILTDKTALDEAQVTYDTPVSVQVKGVALRTLLRKVLSEFGLTYVVKDQAIQITSAAKARDMMVVRSYYIGDIVANINGVLGSFPLLNIPQQQLQTMQNIGQLIDMVQTSVEPASWKSRGGEGTITYHPASMSLVIKQSAEVHAILAGGLFK